MFDPEERALREALPPAAPAAKLADPAAQAIVGAFASVNALIVEVCNHFRRGNIGSARTAFVKARDALGDAGNQLAIYAPPDQELLGMTIGELRAEIEQIDAKTEYLMQNLDPAMGRSRELADQMAQLAARRDRLAAEQGRRRAARRERTKASA